MPGMGRLAASTLCAAVGLLAFGTATSAFIYLCVSWSVSGANYGITGGDTGVPLDEASVKDRAFARARAGGRTVVTERDLAATIVAAAVPAPST